MSNLSAYINVKLKDGRVATVFCHKEGNYDNAGKLLKMYYNSQELAESLVSMGDMSVLGESMTRPSGHSYENPVSGHCVFYYRDRGDALQVKRSYSAMMSAEFSYLWNGKEWLGLDCNTDDLNKGFHSFEYLQFFEIS